ncbi:MAG: type III pantothenate kinase [Thioalkalivibrionaceae bacterium]
MGPQNAISRDGGVHRVLEQSETINTHVVDVLVDAGHTRLKWRCLVSGSARGGTDGRRSYPSGSGAVSADDFDGMLRALALWHEDLSAPCKHIKGHGRVAAHSGAAAGMPSGADSGLSREHSTGSLPAGGASRGWGAAQSSSPDPGRRGINPVTAGGLWRWWIAASRASELSLALMESAFTSKVFAVAVPAVGAWPSPSGVTGVNRLAWSTVYAPDQLGIDRFLAQLGAMSRWGLDFDGWIVDAGTAITVDRLRAGQHLGGWILPGLAAGWSSVAGLVPWMPRRLPDLASGDDDDSRVPDASMAAGCSDGRYSGGGAKTIQRAVEGFDASRGDSRSQGLRFPARSVEALHDGLALMVTAAIERLLRASPGTLVLTGGDAAIVARMLDASNEDPSADGDSGASKTGAAQKRRRTSIAPGPERAPDGRHEAAFASGEPLSLCPQVRLECPQRPVGRRAVVIDRGDLVLDGLKAYRDVMTGVGGE